MTSRTLTLPALLLRVALVLCLIAAATWAVHVIRDALDMQMRPDNEQHMHQVIMIGAVAFVVLLAIPFVPGAEVGLALLAGFGPGIAPLIYVCTVAAMMLAFMIGRFMPIEGLQALLHLLRLHRAADLVGRAAPLSSDERVAMLLDGQSKRVLSLAVRYRYIALALAVNTPGNSLIGGGGGLMMMAGLTGLFTPFLTFLTVLLAVAPVPLAVIFMDLQI